jgi:hypothetical protein
MTACSTTGGRYQSQASALRPPPDGVLYLAGLFPRRRAYLARPGAYGLQLGCGLPRRGASSESKTGARHGSLWPFFAHLCFLFKKEGRADELTRGGIYIWEPTATLRPGIPPVLSSHGFDPSEHVASTSSP